MNLLILLLTALPICLAQFSIQGPSDGNRRAQGLKVSQDKGIEYTDQSDSEGTGDFTIQGATDGNSNFRIQGATDGHSDFQIQGPNDGGAERYNFQPPQAAPAFHIQGATDGHSQSIIQGPYDPNQGAEKSLQYNDPSGLRVNWRSYDRQPVQRPQQEPQYSETAAPVRAPQPALRQRAHSQPQQAPPPPPQPLYKKYDNAPSHIKQLLQFQAQIPYMNVIPEPLRYDSLLQYTRGQEAQHESAAPAPEAPAQRPQYRSKPRGPPRHRRQAPQYKDGGAAQPQYSRTQPPAEPQVHYSPNLPSNLQQLLKLQSQIPYINVIPEQYRFDAEAAAQAQSEQVRAHYANLARQQPAPPREATHQRQKRQAQQHYREAPEPQQQYRRIPQPQAEPLPQYSTNLPSHLQDLLKYQSQTPYNIIANQIRYRLDKPYVPQPIQPSAPAQVQYAGQGEAYQAQPSAQAQSQLLRQPEYPQYPQYSQGQPGHGQGAGIRPVTENQY